MRLRAVYNVSQGIPPAEPAPWLVSGEIGVQTVPGFTGSFHSILLLPGLLLDNRLLAEFEEQSVLRSNKSPFFFFGK